MRNLWITRHGNRLDFINPAWFDTSPRRYDPPLCDQGHVQAQELANRLAQETVDHLFVSPFLRTLQTAQYIACALNLPLKIETGLGEWLNPDWMSEPPVIHPQELCKRDFPNIDWQYHSQVTPQYPESFEQMLRRTGMTARLLTQAYNGNIVLVGHGVSVKGCAYGLLEGEPELCADLCCIVQLQQHGKDWRLILNGDTSHLSSPGAKIPSELRFN